MDNRDPTIDTRPVDGRPIDLKLINVQQQIDSVADTMRQNIDSALERGDRVSILVEKTQDLSAGAQIFNKKTVNLKRRILYRNIKIALAIAFVILVIIAFIVLIICSSGSC